MIVETLIRWMLILLVVVVAGLVAFDAGWRKMPSLHTPRATDASPPAPPAVPVKTPVVSNLAEKPVPERGREELTEVRRHIEDRVQELHQAAEQAIKNREFSKAQALLDEARLLLLENLRTGSVSSAVTEQ